MAFNCKMTRNISLNPDASSTEGGNCGSADIASGGIRERIFVYNIDDIDNLQYENDMRYDNNLIVETIITQEAYYFIDCSDVTYNESQSGDKHTHTLTLTVGNIQPITEDTISDSTNHKYLVAFKPNGSDYYRMFGWKAGADMSYTMDISESSNSYTITFSDESEYPLMTVYPDNFDLGNKIFTPIFKPLYDISYCEVSGGQKTGYCIASYVVKVNSAGQALDRNNMLASYSGLKQDAYRYTRVSADGGYNILGTYDDSATFDGVPVKVFDVTLCPPDASGTITVSPSIVKLNSTTTTQTLTITTPNNWKVSNSPAFVTVSPSTGSGNSTTSAISNGTGGDDVITFQNRTTYERVNVNVQIRLIKINSEYTFDNTVQSFTLHPIAEGGQADYNYSVDISGLTITKQSDGTLLCVVSGTSTEFRTFTFTFTHKDDPTERKLVAVNIQGNNTDPIWRAMSTYCEDL